MIKNAKFKERHKKAMMRGKKRKGKPRNVNSRKKSAELSFIEILENRL
jgi:hypothetical protein